jgi:hypothetical protein
MIYTAYSGENIKRIRVSGETLPNGNSSAEIEIVYENEIESQIFKKEYQK